MTEVPPPRWKVIERGRRLEVIDTQARSPQPTQSSPPPSPLMKPRWMPRRTRFDGGGEITTHRVYDDKGPRQVTLASGDMRMIGVAIGMIALAAVALAGAASVWPWALLILLPWFRRDVRRTGRAAVTRWLDRVAVNGRG